VHILEQLPTRHTGSSRYRFLFNSEIFREKVQITTTIWIISILHLRLMQTQSSLPKNWCFRGSCRYFGPNSSYLANIIAQSLIRHIIILGKWLFQPNQHIIKYFFVLIIKLNHICLLKTLPLLDCIRNLLFRNLHCFFVFILFVSIYLNLFVWMNWVIWIVPCIGYDENRYIEKGRYLMNAIVIYVL